MNLVGVLAINLTTTISNLVVGEDSVNKVASMAGGSVVAITFQQLYLLGYLSLFSFSSKGRFTRENRIILSRSKKEKCVKRKILYKCCFSLY